MTNLTKIWKNNCIRIREDDRYVCLTDMAKAVGKKVSHWNQLQATTAYIQALASVAGIPATELVTDIQGGIPEEQGTWAHPKVAIRFAQWVSPEFAIQVDTWIEELMTTGKVEFVEKLEQQFLPALPMPEVKEYVDLMGEVYGEGYKQRLLPVVLKKFHPHLPIVEPQPTEKVSVSAGEELLTPTQLAQELGLLYKTGSPNPQAVNKLMEELGYQEKGAPSASSGTAWSATQKAIDLKLCDRKPVDTNSRTQKDQLLWNRRILPILHAHTSFL